MSDILSTIVIIILFVISNFINCVSSSVTGWRTPRFQILDLDGHMHPDQHLPDIGFTLTSGLLPPWVLEWEDGPQIIQSITIYACFFFFVSHPRRLDLLRRGMVALSVLNGFRAISILITCLPDPSPICNRQWTGTTGLYKHMPIWPKLFWRALALFTSPNSHATCGDLIYSGHMVFLMVVCKLYGRYWRPSSVPVLPGWVVDGIRHGMRVLTVVGAVVIVATRLHYTIDVLIASYLAHRVFEICDRLFDANENLMLGP